MKQPSVIGRREKKTVCGCYVIEQTLSRCDRGVKGRVRVLKAEHWPVPPLCCQITGICLFSERGRGRPNKYAARPRLASTEQSAVVFPYVSFTLTLCRAAVLNFSVGWFEVFSAMLPVWVSPHMWRTVGKGLTAPSSSLHSLSVHHSLTLSPSFQ